MPEEKNNINNVKPKKVTNRVDEIRSDEIHEILSSVPNWMIGWGSSFILILIVIAFWFSWLIKYPDTISGNIVLTTSNPPVRLVAGSNGKLIYINELNGRTLTSGEIIAEIQSPISLDKIKGLNTYISQVEVNIASNKLLPLVDTAIVFGELQNYYNTLQKLIFDFNSLQRNSNDEKKRSTLALQIEKYNELNLITNNQLAALKEDFKNSQETFNANQILFDRNVISRSEFFQKQSDFKNKQMEVQEKEKSVTENQIRMSAVKQELNDLTFNSNETSKDLISSIQLVINEIRNGVSNWQQSYMIKTPIDGELVYLDNWIDNQYVIEGTPLFAVVPSYNEYILFMNVPIIGSGKVKLGQSVRIKLSNYPHHEFGYLEGAVSELQEIANGEFYKTKIKLNNGLVTSQNKEINFSPEMQGIGEIITEDRRIIERVFIQFRKFFEKK